MKLKTTDFEKINHRKCEKKGCLNKAYALFKAEFLCEDHYREKHPLKEKDYRMVGIYRVLKKTQN